MIYFLYGTDKEKARSNASFFKIDSENFSESILDEKIESQGLFENKYIVFLDSLFEKKEVKQSVLEKIKEIAESQNIFIFLEGKMDKASLSKIEKKAEKVQAFEKAEQGSKFGKGSDKEGFSIFTLADALGRRDKKVAWIIFTKAIMQGVVAEEIHGVLFWQVKSMLLAAPASSAQEADLNPFVFSKAKSFSKNYKVAELQQLSSNLVDIYHQAHRGVFSLESAVEQFLLNI